MMKQYEENQYVLGDSFDYFPSIPNESVDLVFTSCPDLSQTSFSTDQTNEYQSFQRKAVIEMARVIKKDGFVVICQTDRRVNGVILPNHMWYTRCLEEQGLALKDYKIVFRNGVGKKDLYHFTFQHMIVCTKQGKITRKGDWICDTYQDHQQKVGNQSVWSQNFCRYVIENLTEPGDLVIDPFAGVGPVLVAAKALNRRYWGCELEPHFYDPAFSSITGPLV